LLGIGLIGAIEMRPGQPAWKAEKTRDMAAA
jgi:hypothetical protein